jgi:hypothetical protein
MLLFAKAQADYLVSRKFRNHKHVYVTTMKAGKPLLEFTLSEDDKEEAESYHKKLLALSQEELEKLYYEEKASEKQEEEKRIQSLDTQSFFNVKEAAADFDFWAKSSYWTTEEAVALLFGKNPKIVTSDKLKPYLTGERAGGRLHHVSPFAKEFEKVLELAKRAVTWKEIQGWMSPISYLNWAKQKGIGYPEELGERVVLYAKGHVTVEDIKKSFEEFKASTDQRIVQHQQSEQVYLGHIQNLKDRICELESKDKALSTRERDSLLKIVLGMAIKGYRYDPKKSRNEAISDICGDLEQLGISISDDTIRKYLNEAKDFISPEAL